MAGGPSRLQAALASRSPRSYLRIGVVVAVLAGIGVVASAGAYTSTKFLTGDQSAWLQKGRTIAEINGPSGRYETTASDQPVSVANSANDPLQVVQTANGQVYTVDPTTHMVYEVDPNTGQPQAGPNGTQVLADPSDRDVFVLDAGGDTLTPVNPSTMGTAGPAIKIPGPVTTAAIDDNGTVYIGNANGTVTTVSKGKAVTKPLGHGQVYVSVVNNEPVAFEPATGAVFSLADPSSPIVTLQGNAEAPVQLANSQPAGRMWLVWGDVLVGVDLTNADSPQETTLPDQSDYGAPVTNDGMVYVADDTTKQVLVFNPGNNLAQAPPVQVPTGAAGDSDIEVVVRDGAVWADNPTSQDGKLIAGNNVTTINKGTGDGVVNPNAEDPGSKAPQPAPASNPNPNPTETDDPNDPSTDLSPTTDPTTNLPSLPTPSQDQTGPTDPVSPTQTIPQPTTTSTTTPTSTSTSTSTSTTSTTSTDANVDVPDVSGKSATDACTVITTAKLTCNSTITYQQEAAPSGQPDIVVSTDPAANSSQPAGTSITLTVDEVAVPTPQTGQTYTAYCAAANALGFDCTQGTDEGAGAAGTTTDQVDTVTDQGQLEPPGTAISANYFSSAQPPQEPIPNCVGEAYTACTSSDFTIVPTQQATASTATCNQVFQQTPPASQGTAPEGSSITIEYDPTCAVPLYESDLKGNEEIHYLSLTNDSPAPGTAQSDWNYAVSSQDGAYPVSGGTCSKDGTEPVYRFKYTDTTTDPGKTLYHWYFTTDGSFDDPGWSDETAVFCVFGTAVPGTVPIYANYQNKPTVPGNYSWSPGDGGSNVSLAWYQPTVSS